MSKLIIYHGSTNIIEKPFYHGGKSTNDYGFGFYCTESLELAKEWSCSNNENNGFANKYSLDLDGLKILNLMDQKYSILNWIAILLNFRSFDLITPLAKEAKKYLIENFYIDVNQYDVIIGYRADDSYFSFAKDFVNNVISIRKLEKAMKLGHLGQQVVIVSKKAYERLCFEGFEVADTKEYYIKRKTKDEKAREEYYKETKNSKIVVNDLFILHIIRRGLKDGDPIL